MTNLAAVNNQKFHQYGSAETAQLLPFDALIDAIAAAATEYARGEIASPERLGVPLKAGGIMLTMPASASDIAVQKLVNIAPQNGKFGKPTIHGHVVVCDVTTGELEFILDGPTVTGRRTAAVSMLAIRELCPQSPTNILLIGTGTQAEVHAHAIAALYPEAVCWVRGTSAESEKLFQKKLAQFGVISTPAPQGPISSEIDVVITLTTSKTPVYEEAAIPSRLVIGVGAFTPDAAEIGPITIHSSRIYVDDLSGAHVEAGDLLQAGIDWQTVGTLADVLANGAIRSRPIVFKSVGCAAWDLAACRVAKNSLRQIEESALPA